MKNASIFIANSLAHIQRRKRERKNPVIVGIVIKKK
jgi:hypothetical protein